MPKVPIQNRAHIFLSFALILSCALTCKVVQHRESEAVQRSGFYITQVPGLASIRPANRGSLLWGWSYSKSGLQLLDYDTLESPINLPLLPERKIEDVVACPEGSCAWVITYSENKWRPSIFFVQMDTLEITECPLLDDRIGWKLIPVKGGREAWAIPTAIKVVTGKDRITSSPKGFHALDKSHVRHLLTDQIVKDIRPMDHSNAAWVISSRSDTARDQLFVVDSSGTILHDISVSLPGIAISQVYTAKDGRYAWILTEDQQVYVVDSDAHLLNGGNPLFSGAKVSGVDLSANGTVGWLFLRESLAPASRKPGLYIYDIQRGELNNGQPVLDNQVITEYAVLPGGNGAWITNIDGKTLLVSLDNPELTTSLLSERFGAVSVEWISEGNRAWVILLYSQRTGLLLYEPNGEPLSIEKRALAVQLGQPYSLTTFSQYEGGKVLLLTLNELMRRPKDEGLDSFVARTVDTLPTASISFGGIELNEADGMAVLTVDPDQGGRDVRVKLPFRERNSASGARVSVQITDNGKLVADAAKMISEPGDIISITLTWREGTKPAFNKPYKVSVRYTDDFGSDFGTVWSKVTFNQPLWRRPRIRSLFLFGILCLLFIGLLKLRTTMPLAAKWLPVPTWVLGAVAFNVPTIVNALTIDGPLLAILLSAALLFSLPLGLISPQLFRTLAQVAPFQWAAPWALLIPKCRMRVYSSYLSELKEQLRRSLRAASNESYVSLPVTIVEGSQTGTKRIVTEPAEEILRYLTNPNLEQRATVTVNSPGGRGKSALVREVLRIAIAEFEKDDRFPIPVICNPNASANFMEDLISQALGRHLISKDCLNSELEMGWFIVVIDGVTESKLKPEVIDNFVRSERGVNSRLLISKRPDLELEKSIHASSRWLDVAPMRLDEHSFDLFENAYIKADFALTNVRRKPLSRVLKEICKASDGTYLPILVRFCLLAANDRVNTVADIYEATFFKLLGDNGQQERLRESGALCVETYWKDHLRTIALTRVSRTHLPIVTLLLNSQILVPVEETRNSITSEPTEATFFHDSMQSYLTAYGLFQQEEAWEHLARAAGDHDFRRSQDNLLGVLGSELFQMCLAIYKPQERLSQQLIMDLTQWAVDYDDHLTKAEVKAALPKSILDQVAAAHNSEEGAGSILHFAVQACAQDGLDNQIANLASIYYYIAPLAWTIQETRQKQADIDPHLY